MAGKIAGTVFILFVLTLLVALIIFYFLHMSIREEVNNINYNVIETVAVTGVFSSDLYTYLKDSIRRYGDYTVKLKLEKLLQPGQYDVYFDDSEIIGRALKVGDRITIYLEDQELTLFGRLINAAFMGYKPGRVIETRIKSLKTAVVSKNGE